MNKTISICALVGVLITNSAVADLQPCVRCGGGSTTGRIVYNQPGGDSNHSNDNTKTVALVAVGLAVIALVVAVKASENNPGQVRLMQF